jgi:hypothetical protein
MESGKCRLSGQLRERLMERSVTQWQLACSGELLLRYAAVVVRCAGTESKLRGNFSTQPPAFI